MPVLNLLSLPMAVVSVTLLGAKFYRLSKEWYRRVHLDPNLPAELLPDWFLERAKDAAKGAPNRDLGKVTDFAVVAGDAIKSVPGWVKHTTAQALHAPTHTQS